jgi:uncharacterized protein
MAAMTAAPFSRSFWLLAVLLALVSGCGSASAPPSDAPPAVLSVVLAGERFALEVAATPEARFQGLSDREFIAPDGGMIFTFPEARPMAFVMRRCPVPIDLIFVSEAGRVVATHAMRVEPDPNAPDHLLTQYPSGYPAIVAVELAGGRVAELGIEPGDALNLPMADLKRWAR